MLIRYRFNSAHGKVNLTSQDASEHSLSSTITGKVKLLTAKHDQTCI